jgi:hypothetical protein
MQSIQSLMIEAITEYTSGIGVSKAVRTVGPSPVRLDFTASTVAKTLGGSAGSVDPITAAYWLSVTYTAMLPDGMRSRLGVYYTPPP